MCVVMCINNNENIILILMCNVCSNINNNV